MIGLEGIALALAFVLCSIEPIDRLEKEHEFARKVKDFMDLIDEDFRDYLDRFHDEPQR